MRGILFLCLFYISITSGFSVPNSNPKNNVASAATKEMATKWSKTASKYVRYFEPSCLVFGRFMLNLMKIQFQDEPLNILEAGAGAGGLAQELLRLPGLSLEKLTVTDLAEGMLKKAKEKFHADGTMDKVTMETQDFTKFTYSDASFDRYYANLCLCYAPTADDVIKEASRVLKPKGIAGFTVWGKSADSPLMTIVPDVLDELKLDPHDPNKRSSFHLGEDDVALREQFLSQGFSKCTVLHYPAAMECFDASAYVELIIDGAASTKAQVESFSQEDQKRVRKQVHDRAKAILDAGDPMKLDMAVIVAQKE